MSAFLVLYFIIIMHAISVGCGTTPRSTVMQTSLGNGVNLQPSYYNNGQVSFGWELMGEYFDSITTVRIEIEPDKVSQAIDWISEASKAGYKIIATYHKCTVLGSDDVEDLLDAARWWKENYDTLRQAGNFTVNVMNEWGSHEQTVYSFSSAYNEAIALIRTVCKTGRLVVDIPGWGQETHIAAEASSLLSDDQIIFSAHVYENGWNGALDRFLQPSDMTELFSTGRPCIIGEFGFDSGNTNDSNANVNVTAVVEQAKSLGFESVLAWAWNGDGGTVMNMVEPPWNKQPLAVTYSTNDYFEIVINLLDAIIDTL